MSKKLFSNRIGYVSIFTLIFFCGAANSFAGKDGDVNVENRTSANANSGGNVIAGSGIIRTGDASASVETRDEASGKNQTRAKAQVQGGNSQASVEINGEKKVCAGKDESGCQVEIDNQDNSMDEGKDGENVIEEMKNEDMIVPDNDKKDIARSAYDLVSGLRRSIISWFN